jgi:DNA topoisomerase-1
MDGSVRPEPEMLDELCPECGRQLQKRVGRFGPFTGCSGYPDCKYIKKDPPVSTGVTCPQCKQGELIEKRSRFGTMFYSCSRYPDCDCAVGNPPEKDHPCPQCGSLLLRRPKSLRCWGCGAELDLDFHVTKDGDVEAETAARQAKAAAKAARAAAKKPTAKKSTAKKSTRKKSTAKKQPAAKKKPAARKQPAATTTAAASIPSTEGPAEG